MKVDQDIPKKSDSFFINIALNRVTKIVFSILWLNLI